MKKKLCMFIAMVCCLSMVSAVAFADPIIPDGGGTAPGIGQIEIEQPEGDAQPCYDTINTTLISYGIDGSTAGVYTKLTSKSGITSARVKIQIIKSTGTVVGSYTGTMTKAATSIFTKSKNFSLSSKGSYYARVTFYTYKNGVLKETVTKTTGYDTYS